MRYAIALCAYKICRMKTVLVRALLAVVLVDMFQVNASENKEETENKAKVISVIKQCEKEEHFSRSEADKVRMGGFNDAEQKDKCFLKCLLEKLRIFVDNKFDENEATLAGLSILGEETKAVMDKCHVITPNDPCETGFHAYKCYYENIQKKLKTEKPKDKTDDEPKVKEKPNLGEGKTEKPKEENEGEGQQVTTEGSANKTGDKEKAEEKPNLGEGKTEKPKAAKEEDGQQVTTEGSADKTGGKEKAEEKPKLGENQDAKSA